MVDRFNALSRQQIARFVGDDPEAIRAFEKVFEVSGQGVPDIDGRIDELEVPVAANTARIKTNEVLLWLSM